jgi:hypothetical protein
LAFREKPNPEYRGAPEDQDERAHFDVEGPRLGDSSVLSNFLGSSALMYAEVESTL